ncbi:next to brca1 gene 1 protein [Plakobranchus ocellatus]|uniref:Next to brca1 gene 1 protein n=1 Tax=Plakobranchus ocellatus TaxID=259542 RepID=A0AAV4A194_9GAST|nr:next to brca1 gene 1 protein [Plakobranchus ocellatus]
MDVDVDNEFDGELLNQFRTLGTTDRDVLIAEFQAVLGNTLNPESCAFFLDMNDWNLQNAVCSYYDLEQPVATLPSMKVLEDITTGNGEAVAPNTCFVKSWRLKNSGNESWPPGCQLRYYSGDNLSTVERKLVPVLSPGESVELNVEMKSPLAPGHYHCVWRMFTPTGTLFGDVIQWSIVVAEGGLLGITQQLARISGGGIGSNAGEMMVSAKQQQQQQETTASMDQQQQQHVTLLSHFIPALEAQPPPTAIEDDTEMS